MPSRSAGTLRPLAALLACLAGVLSPGPGEASQTGDQGNCVKRIGEAVQAYSQTIVGAVGACKTGNVSSATPIDCVDDSDVKEQIKEAGEKLLTSFGKCIPASLAEVCALGQTTPPGLYAALASPGGALRGPLDAILDDLFDAPVAGCPRPEAPVSKAAANCSKTLAAQSSRVLAQIQQCVSKCEVSWTKSGGEICIAPDSGEPLRDKVIECVARARQRMIDTTANRCSAATLAELGCPLGAKTPEGVGPAFDAAIFRATRDLWTELYHSSCRTVIQVAPISPTASVELNPSGTVKTITCGDVLDDDFFAGDDELVLRSDLNCQDVQRAVNGLIIAASDINVDLGKDYRVSGPARASLRTGTGVLVRGNGVVVNRGVVQRFGTGVADTIDADGLEVEQLVVRGNAADGIRINGTGARLNSNSVKENGGDGIRFRGSANTAVSNTLESNGGSGVNVSGADCVVDGNQLGSLRDKGNLGYGLRVTGPGANVYSNTAEANVGGGFDIGAPTIRFKGNDAVSNSGTGFRFTADGSSLDSNRADANAGAEFEIGPGNIDLSGNRANGTMIEFPVEGGIFE